MDIVIRSFLENLVKGYQNMKYKNNRNTIFENVKKLPWIPNVRPKLNINLRKLVKISGEHLQRTLCKSKAKLLPGSNPDGL